MGLFMDLPKRVRKAFGGRTKILEVRFFFIDENLESRNCIKEDGEYYKPIKTIKHIYDNILVNDNNWHFFNEGSYYILRCSEQFYDEVCYELEQAGFGINECGEWIDEQYITRKYQDVYQIMFHGFSVMAMKDYDYEELDYIYDRVSHCFLNHQLLKWIGALMEDDAKIKLDRYWEPTIVSRNALRRMDYMAYIDGRLHEERRAGALKE